MRRDREQTRDNERGYRRSASMRWPVVAMTRKIRELIKDLRDAGFIELPGRGKGSHHVYKHPDVPGTMVDLAGEPGEDAKDYQEKQVKGKIEKARRGQQ